VRNNKPKPQEVPVAEISRASGTEPTKPQPNAERRRILVVEDNRDAADSLRMLLELMGHEVRVAHSGPEGVRAAQEWRPTIVLCDIGLPGMDGFAVAEELRTHPGTATTRLIAVTGYGHEDDRRHSREAGFDHHLVKPVDPEELQKVLLSA
jgi:two-component system CheB/CheR fusion protein